MGCHRLLASERGGGALGAPTRGGAGAGEAEFLLWATIDAVGLLMFMVDLLLYTATVVPHPLDLRLHQ